jgi:single-strand selective monofunctional uracil DNA glycosylase
VSLAHITDDLLEALDGSTFAAPVTHTYNSLVYARPSWDEYCDRFGAGPKEVVLVGMNPGPWGMAQTGVPFGEIAAVRDWMGIDLSRVGKPDPEHPKRPVLGGACTRSEVSGRRLWGWAAERFGTAEAFFERFFVLNYCPLSFMEEGGRNRIPEKLPRAERDPIFTACDAALRATIEHLQPKLVLGVGKFAEKRAAGVLKGLDLQVASILHPSPASPAANRGWAPQAEAQLRALGVEF